MVKIGNFNTKESGTMEQRSALPKGDYIVSIVASKRVEKEGTSKWNIHLNAKILDGPKKDQTALIVCNYGYPGTAGDIAKRQLGSICEAVGKSEINDTSELHNVPFVLRTQPQKDNPEYNDHKAFYSVDRYRQMGPKDRWVIAEPAPSTQVSIDVATAGDTPYSEKLKDFPSPDQQLKEQTPW